MDAMPGKTEEKLEYGEVQPLVGIQPKKSDLMENLTQFQHHIYSLSVFVAVALFILIH